MFRRRANFSNLPPPFPFFFSLILHPHSLQQRGRAILSRVRISTDRGWLGISIMLYAEESFRLIIPLLPARLDLLVMVTVTYHLAASKHELIFKCVKKPAGSRGLMRLYFQNKKLDLPGDFLTF